MLPFREINEHVRLRVQEARARRDLPVSIGLRAAGRPVGRFRRSGIVAAPFRN